MLQPTLFDSDRLDLSDSIGLTAQSLAAYGPKYRHWAVAYSGGKDSTTLLSAVLYLIRSGRVAPPERLPACYADTRMELPPLAAAAEAMLSAVKAEGYETEIALPPLDDRFFVYMLGRGVPPPSNTFRWCTGQIKIEPMAATLARIATPGEKILVLTGVRQGESAVRDGKIAMSCGKNGAECGQGWYQESLPHHLCDTLAPILHWRVCLVWGWLATGSLRNAPEGMAHGYPTGLVAEAYGLHEEGSEGDVNARTGCNGCPLATRDTALDALLKSPRWQYLEPLRGLRPIFRWLREPAQRIRKPGFEFNKAGVKRYTNRMGPLTMAARLAALERILAIQAECNRLAPDGMPRVDTINFDEEARVRELVGLNTWPNRWTGDEPAGDVPFNRVHADGTEQLSIPGWLTKE